MGLGRPPVPSEEEAYAQAQATLVSLSLPHKLDSGATITRCRTICQTLTKFVTRVPSRYAAA